MPEYHPHPAPPVRPARTLRWRLPLLVVGLIAGVLGVFTLANYRELERTLTAAGLARAQGAVDQLISLLAPGTQQRAQDLKALAADPSIRELLHSPAEADRSHVESRLRSLGGSGRQIIELWDTAGQRVFDLAMPPNTAELFPEPAAPTGAAIRLSQRPNGPVVSDVVEPIADSVNGQPGRPLGYLVMRRPVGTASPDTLNKLVGSGAQIHLGGGTSWTNLTAIVEPSPVERRGSGTGEFSAADGVRKLGAVGEIRDTPWLVSVEFPRDSFLAPARAFLYRMAGTAVVLILVALVFSRILMNRITGPLAEMTSAAEAIAAGKRADPIETRRSDEIGRLGAAFNSMVSQIDTAHEDLMLAVRGSKEARDKAISDAHHAEFIAAVAVAMREGGDLAGMLGRCAEAGVHHLDARAVRIWTIGAQAGVLDPQASAGPVPEAAEALAARAAQERRPLTDDRSNVAFPLMFGHQLMGVLAVFSDTGLPDDRVAVLEQAAGTIALGVERKRLNDGRERIENLLESATDFVTMARVTGPPLYINRAARQALGVAPGETVASLYEFRPPGFVQFFETTILPAALKDGTWKGQTEYLTRSGARIPVSQVTIAHRSADWSVQYVSTISRDISDELRVQRERANLEEQLQRAQKMEAIGQLAGGLAHDFNNLLTIIIGYANVLFEDLPAGDARRDDVDQIRGAGTRAAQLTRQLLAFSRKQILNPVVLNPNRLLDGIRPMLTRLVGESIELVVNVDPSIGAIKFDPTQLELILVNLTVNARDAMPNGGRLTIETANVDLDDEFCRTHLSVEPGRYVRLSVTDTGVGIDAETRKHIFEPFFTTKARDKGTGLGLATVFGIVKQSGGSVWVYSEPGMGASFKVFLPVAAGTAVAPVAGAEQPVARGSETILLVEDEAAVRQLVETVLRRAGYQVMSAPAPSRAIDIAADPANRIDLLVTDVVMPEINGAVLSREIGRTRPSLRTLFMSGFADDTIEHHGVLAGGTAFLQKPFTAAALTQKVREVLDGPASTTDH